MIQVPFSGTLDGEDAPDVVTCTFLSAVTEEQMSAIGSGFLLHRESKQFTILQMLTDLLLQFGLLYKVI